jgi:hypothetical protein
MESKAKRSYQRPEIRQVRLVPQEAVLSACKTTLQSGPEQTFCQVDLVNCSELLS